MAAARQPPLNLPVTNILAVAKGVLEGKIPLSVCEIVEGRSATDGLRDVIEIKKGDSVSPSTAVYAMLYHDQNFQLPITIKMWVDIGNIEQAALNKPEGVAHYYHGAGLEYEAHMYSFVTRNIILPGYSPNFVGFVMYGCCDGPAVGRYLQSLAREDVDYVKRIKMLPPPVKEEQKLCLLVTERAGNGRTFGQKFGQVMSLRNCIIAKDPEKKVEGMNLKMVLFQIVQAIRIMNDLEITHNDLHAANILVAKFERPIDMVFMTSVLVPSKNDFVKERKAFRFQTRFVPYIFDWDHAFSPRVGKNLKLKLYGKHNIGNKTNPHLDLFSVLCATKIWDEPPFSLVFDSKAVKAVREKRTIRISLARLAELRQIAPIGVNLRGNVPISIYMMSPIMLEKFGLSDFFDNLEQVKYAFVTVDGEGVASLDYVHPCRLQLEESVYHTAVRVLGYAFKEFEIHWPEAEASTTPYKYVYDVSGERMNT